MEDGFGVGRLSAKESGRGAAVGAEVAYAIFTARKALASSVELGAEERQVLGRSLDQAVGLFVEGQLGSAAERAAEVMKKL